MDDDLLTMNSDSLRAEVIKLRAAIRQQRDQSGHDLCWFVPELWSVLPEQVQPQPEVPEWGEFIKRCAAFRQTLNPQT